MKNRLLLAGVLILSSAAMAPHAQQSPTFGQALQTKFQSRLTSLNALLDVLNDRLDIGRDYQAGVTFCAAGNMFYMPSKPSADADGCVGLDTETISGTDSMNIYASSMYWGAGIGRITTYTIPNDVYAKMNSGVFQGKFGKAGTMVLNVTKGTTSSVVKNKQWDDGWFGEDKCRVTLEYDGSHEIRVGIEGDDGHGKCRGHMQKLDWIGKKIILK